MLRAIWEGVWLLLGMALTLAMEWDCGSLYNVKDGPVLWPLTLAGSDGSLAQI